MGAVRYGGDVTIVEGDFPTYARHGRVAWAPRGARVSYWRRLLTYEPHDPMCGWRLIERFIAS